MEGANYDVRFTGRAADSNISVRSMSRLGEKPTQSLTVSQALAAAYSSMNITKEPEVIQKNERPKPWLKYQKSYMAPGKLRQKLISLKSISKGLEFKPDVPVKIGLRLEQAMGTTRLKLFDHKYMSKLTESINAAEEIEFNTRIEKRKQMEVKRHRQLVIEGMSEPEAGEQFLLSHPVLRCKRIIDRVKKHSFDAPVNPRKLKKISQVEPFENYERGGMLFGFHKHHYLRAERVASGSIHTPDPSPEPSTYKLPAHLTRRQSSTPNNNPPTENVRDDSTDNPTEREQIEESMNSGEETPVENVPEVLSVEDSTIEISPDEVSSTEVSEEEEFEMEHLEKTSPLVDDAEEGLIDNEEMSLMSHLHPLTMNDLERLYKRAHSPLIDKFYAEEQSTESLFTIGTGIIQTYRREQAKTDDFCKNALRKVAPTNQNPN